MHLDGVIKSTFSRDYQPNVPSFTTNFFSNTAKRISCGIENIVNPHDSYSVRLARPDDTILDTQVLNDATPFFLQFTESDYGTYDYKLLLSKWTTTSTSNPNIPPESYWVDTVIATHQHIFVRPEPTFTTSWTKSGLSITADLSSIVGAHPEFYAYLCRTDGTTLATHQFQTGQTTTSLTFTEADYGSYNYQLKLGTVVKSSHTETYVRPTPTYTASFSTNELTLTASITSITNAHNSFAITLERDDGTVLQTHTLADGETSFTFTQTETSYATFNYIVKINGAQTDTYSATYTPPPTPTFDIALTNDDLAITATLTNIVNPDPYYTVSIHNDTSTQVASHTLQSSDTTVVLTWTESSYSEKTYTKLLNGTSIGTETITLTDQNASTSLTYSSEYQSLVGHAEPQTGDYLYYNNNGTPTQTEWVILDVYSDNDIRYKINQSGWNTYQQKNRGIGWTGSGWMEDPWSLSTDKEPDLLSNDGTFSSASATCLNGATIYTWTTGGASYAEGSFISPFYEAPPTFTNFPSTIAFTGWWNDQFNRHYQLTTSTDTFIQYELYDANGLVGAEYGSTFTSTPSGILFNVEDVGDSSTPFSYSNGSTFVGTSGIVQAGDSLTLWTNTTGTGTAEAVLTVPDFFYEAPAYRTGTSQGFAFTSGTWKGYGYTAIIDDEANSSSGKLVNGVRQFEWDMPDIGGGRLYSGANNWIYFVPGTAEDNGTWYHGTTSTGGTAGTRNGRVISIGTSATFDETNAFVSGLVPYGDIP